MGRRNYKAKDFISAIQGSGGIITTIANRVGCKWHTAKKYITEYATVARAYENERSRVLDLAETKVIQAIRDGNLSMVRWYLSTIGKDRGYTKRLEHSIDEDEIDAAISAELERLASARKTKVPDPPKADSDE